MMAKATFPESRIGNLVGRRTPRETEHPFALALDNIESWTGQLRDRPGPEGVRSGNYFEPGDVLFGKLRPYLAKAWASDRAGVYIGDFLCLVPRGNASSRFLSYVLRTRDFIQRAAASSYGSKMPRIEWDSFKALDVPAPAPSEQRAIADYLDHETAEIDALIEELNALFSLTNERKSATREKMLSSVVASPRQKLSWHVSFHNGDRGESYPSREEFVRSGIPFINAGHLHNGNVSFRDMNYLTEEQFHSMGGAKLRSGDVLFCLRGSVGKSGIFSGETGALASSLVAIRTLPSLTAEYLSAWLESLPVKSQINSYLTGSAQPNLSVDQLSRLRIPVVPTTEQLRITDELARERKTVESLLNNVNSAVYLARERRAALISAAVTGQIDVMKRHKPVAEVLEDEVRERV